MSHMVFLMANSRKFIYLLSVYLICAGKLLDYFYVTCVRVAFFSVLLTHAAPLLVWNPLTVIFLPPVKPTFGSLC